MNCVNLISLLGLSAAMLAGCGRESAPRPDVARGPEVMQVRIARQYGLSYLPLILMEEQHLIEKHARAAGLGDVKTVWVTVTGGAAATDALLSGSVDYIATGVTPLITLWSKSGKEVKGVAALDATPILLNTIKPNARSIRDFSDRDRIAVPAVKVSIQAVILQMAAAREFGQSNYAKLDPLTVTMKHPDAQVALLSGQSEITAHLASPPFSFQEQKNTRVKTVMNSFEVLGGPHTFNVLSTTSAFYQRNPGIYAAVLAALEEAVESVGRDKRAAAELYLRTSKSKDTLEDIVAQLSNPSVTYTTTPLKIGEFADFMHQVGAIKERPDWKDLFFPPIHNKPGN